MAGNRYKLKFNLSDGTTQSVEFTVPQGADGKSAYQTAQEAGYTGTEEEFAEKLAAEITDTEALEMLVECGVITPACASDGTVYTLNGKIVTI